MCFTLTVLLENIDGVNTSVLYTDCSIREYRSIFYIINASIFDADLHTYLRTYVMTFRVYRFVDANGNQYYPVKELDGPYYGTTVFTGPKVKLILCYVCTYLLTKIFSKFYSPSFIMLRTYNYWKYTIIRSTVATYLIPICIFVKQPGYCIPH